MRTLSQFGTGFSVSFNVYIPATTHHQNSIERAWHERKTEWKKWHRARTLKL